MRNRNARRRYALSSGYSSSTMGAFGGLSSREPTRRCTRLSGSWSLLGAVGRAFCLGGDDSTAWFSALGWSPGRLHWLLGTGRCNARMAAAGVADRGVSVTERFALGEICRASVAWP